MTGAEALSAVRYAWDCLPSGNMRNDLGRALPVLEAQQRLAEASSAVIRNQDAELEQLRVAEAARVPINVQDLRTALAHWQPSKVPATCRITPRTFETEGTKMNAKTDATPTPAEALAAVRDAEKELAYFAQRQQGGRRQVLERRWEALAAALPVLEDQQQELEQLRAVGRSLSLRWGCLMTADLNRLDAALGRTS